MTNRAAALCRQTAKHLVWWEDPLLYVGRMSGRGVCDGQQYFALRKSAT